MYTQVIVLKVKPCAGIIGPNLGSSANICNGLQMHIGAKTLALIYKLPHAGTLQKSAAWSNIDKGNLFDGSGYYLDSSTTTAET